MAIAPYFTKPPAGARIDLSHPRVRGLVGCYDFLELGGQVARDGIGRYGDGAFVNGPKIKNLQGGHVLDLASASTQYVTIPYNSKYPLVAPANASTAFVSISCRFRMNSLRNYNAIVTTQASNTPSTLFDMYCDAAGSLVFGTGGLTPTIATLAANVWYHLVLTWDYNHVGTTTINKIWLNGVEIRNSSTNQNVAPSVSAIHIGTRGDFFTLMDGQFDFVRVWERGLSLAEAREEWVNPWGIYKRLRALPFSVAVTDLPQSVTVGASVGISATEADADATSTTAAVSAGVSASGLLNAAESVAVGVAGEVSASPVTNAPENPAVHVSVDVSAIQAIVGGDSVSVDVAAGVSASEALASAAAGSADVSVGVSATTGTDLPQSVSVDVSAGAGASKTASASVSVAASLGVTSSGAARALPSVVVGVSLAVVPLSSEFMQPGTIQSGESFGTPNVAGPMNPGTIASAESFGTPTLNVKQTASPGTITSGESFGAPTVSHVTTLHPGTIASAESFGTPTLLQASRPLLPGTIPSGESFGAPTLSGGKNTLQGFVGNYERSRYLRRGTARLQSQTLGRWSGSIEFQNIPGGDLRALDTSDEWTPQHGQTILIKEFGRTLMRGCIKELTASRPLSTQLVIYTCQLADKTAICDRRVIRIAYPDVSQGLKQWDIADVIRDIHANYLDGEGIILDPNLPASLGDLTTPLSPFIKVTQAYDTIRDITGLQWFIDLNQILRFTDTEEAEEAPFEITETSKNWRNLSVKVSDADYRNRQYVVSNRKILPTASGAGGSSRVESYTMLDFGTGHMPVFPDHTGYQQEALVRGLQLGDVVLQFGIGSITGIKVNLASKHVYQTEQLTESQVFGADDYWQYFTSQTVDFVTPHFFLQAGDVVEITYVPATNTAAANVDPVLVVEQPFEAAPGEQFGTCGSGRYDAVEQVNDVGTQEGLDAVAAGLLERSGVIPKTVTVETDVPGLQVGMRLHVDVPRQLCDDLDMFITGLVGQSVDGEDLGSGSSFRWTVTATNFPDVGNWKKTWERLWRRTQHPQPIDRTVAATVILAPGAALRDNSTFNTPRKVDETGLLSEIVCRFDTPPVDQYLIIDIKVDGVSILTSARLVVPAGFTGDVVLTEFARANLYLFKDQTITGLCTYRVTGAHPVAARNGTISIRTTA